MGNLNKVMLIGRLGNDPEKKTLPTGATVVNLTLATSEHFKDKSGRPQERTEWHKVTLWNKLADLAEQYLKKGSQVYIEGSLQTTEWKDKDGNKRYTTEVVAKVILFLDSNNQQSGQRYEQGQQQPPESGYPPNH